MDRQWVVAASYPLQAVMSGVQDVVIAAGVEHMTTVPIGGNIAAGFKAGHGAMDETMRGKYVKA